MYLHLGSDVIIKKADIVGIFELDGNVTSTGVKEYLKTAEKSGCLVSAGYDLPKSFVIVKNGEMETVYLSHISVSSLVKRCALPF